MLPKQRYNLLVGLFPILYLIHNTEEWFMLNAKITAILSLIPSRLGTLISNDPQRIVSIFGIALVVATLLPLIVALFIWDKVTNLNIKILLVMALVTLINAISHISSSVALNFISPGLITSILLCIPYSLAIISFIQKHYRFTKKQYLLLGFCSVAVYILGLGISWFVGVSIVS